jgi:hypothetical protein
MTAPRDRAPCRVCDGTGIRIPPVLETIDEASCSLAPDEQVVEVVEVLVGQQAWRIELLRGAGGESLRFRAIEPASGALQPLVIDDALAQPLQRVVASGGGGIRRVLDGMCREWTRRGAR